jgi:hypothetical protein
VAFIRETWMLGSILPRSLNSSVSQCSSFLVPQMEKEREALQKGKLCRLRLKFIKPILDAGLVGA